MTTNESRAMPTLCYVSLVRFPTEKAHGLQIAQNCEAFADAGYDVKLWVANRRNSYAMQQITDPHAHYGVQPNFALDYLPCVDLYRFTGGNKSLERLAFYVQIMTTILSLLWRLRLPSNHADVYYSRDEALLLALSIFFPPERLAYEAHLFRAAGGRLQAALVGRVGHIIAITPRLADDLITQRGAAAERVMVAHDGFRQGRFANLPDTSTARERIGWDDSAFVVGFVGRLHMLDQDKGVGTLVEAAAQVEGVSLALVGGPDEMAERYRAQWQALGQPHERFLYAGQVPPDDVPRYLRAFDVCAMPHPFTEQFAYYTSPLKLFEYMAAGRAIVASDLPAWADVITHEQDALLVPPSDVHALAAALRRLRDDTALRQQLGDNAYHRAHEHYTWAARAERIKAHLERGTVYNETTASEREQAHGNR